jgi:hypothetical protein
MYEDELEKEEQDSFREIPVGGGDSSYVESHFHPMLMEWDWQYDPVTEQVIRMEEGKAKPLFLERLRWHYKLRRANSEDLPLLDRKGIRGTFGHLPAFRSMLALSQKQRDYASAEEGYSIPAATHFLSEALSTALLMYFEWQGYTNVWTFTNDPEGLIPGALSLQPKTVSYATLGEWMDSEYTGDWQRSHKSATGIVPQTYKMLLQRRMMDIWRELVKQENYGKVSGKKVEKLLRDGERPAFLTVRYARDLVGHYSL